MWAPLYMAPAWLSKRRNISGASSGDGVAQQEARLVCCCRDALRRRVARPGDSLPCARRTDAAELGLAEHDEVVGRVAVMLRCCQAQPLWLPQDPRVATVTARMLLQMPSMASAGSDHEMAHCSLRVARLDGHRSSSKCSRPCICLILRRRRSGRRRERWNKTTRAERISRAW